MTARKVNTANPTAKLKKRNENPSDKQMTKAASGKLCLGFGCFFFKMIIIVLMVITSMKAWFLFFFFSFI